MRVVDKGRVLRFRVATDVPEPFDLYWKVRNRGQEAERIDQLRGQIFKDNGSRGHTEHTLYPGRNYVEVYVVKNGLVVATDHHEVVIR